MHNQIYGFSLQQYTIVSISNATMGSYASKIIAAFIYFCWFAHEYDEELVEKWDQITPKITILYKVKTHGSAIHLCTCYYTIKTANLL